MAAIRLSFLDQICVTADVGGPITGLPQKLVALLGLTAAERSRTASVERLGALLWPDAAEPYARKSLNQLLVRARRMLPGVLERPDERVVALSPDVACDVHDLLFGKPAGHLPVPSPGARYEFLPGFSIRGCGELNDWLDATRSLVRTRAARAALERAGELDAAASYPWAAAAYGLDRADERVAAAYLHALGAVKGPAAAWSAYVEHRRWLHEELDIAPSPRLVSAAIESCRGAGLAVRAEAGDVVPTAMSEPSSPAGEPRAGAPLPAGPGSEAPAATRPGRGWRRGRVLEAGAALAVLAMLTTLALRTMRTPPAAARTFGIEMILGAPSGGSLVGDSAVRLASAHLLAEHQVAAEVLGGHGTAAALRLPLPAGRLTSSPRVAVAPPQQAVAERLAAILVDTALVLLARNAGTAQPAVGAPAAKAAELLAEAQAARSKAGVLAATGGEGPALLMLGRADSLAGLAARREPRDWHAPALRAEIANQVFWSRLVGGAVQPELLSRGTALAEAAVRLGGGAAALETRASLSFSLWVSGAVGAERAGDSARRDYAAVVESAPGRGEAWSRLAQLYHAEGRLSDAYSAGLQALTLTSSPRRLEAYMELFLAALDRGDNAGARRWCAEISFHSGATWLAGTCSAMYAWANPQATDPIIEPNLDAEPDALRPALQSQLALLRAGAELARGNGSAARARIAAAGTWYDRDPEVAIIWAGVLIEQGQIDSAKATLRAYLRGAPSRRGVLGRPWLRPLYRSQESAREFTARLDAAPPL